MSAMGMVVLCHTVLSLLLAVSRICGFEQMQQYLLILRVVKSTHAPTTVESLWSKCCESEQQSVAM